MCNGKYWKQKGFNKNENQSYAELPNCKNVQKKILEANWFRQKRKAKLRAQCTFCLQQAP